jgi:hypothetical protein
MKKIVFALSFLVFVFTANAQVTQDDILYVQSAYGKSKRDLMQQYMTFKDSSSGNKFWRLYDSYEAERKKLGQDYIQIIKQYADGYSTLDNTKADLLVTKVSANNMAYQKLYSTYYGKIKMAVGALKAAQFLQLESYLQNAVRMSVMDQIPFIGEIDRSKLAMPAK